MTAKDIVTKWVLHVETRLKPRAAPRFDAIRSLVHSYLQTYGRISIPSVLQGWEDVPELAASVERIVATDCISPSPTLSPNELVFQIHVYQPCDTEMFEEFASGGQGGGEDEDGTTVAATVCELPNQSLEGLWESLIFTHDIKRRLLDYIQATLTLSDANVDLNLISWNRVVLLHGPPGTGKTSLCRALAQKLAIRLSHRYSHARLLEINAHSLFSKWFSESGKLVQRLFSSITEMVDEDDAFVVVLIDEVESLTAARAGAMAGTEPSDGLRVVNALLTQIDKLKQRKNVLIMSTSNLVKAIDNAFIDRADIIQFVGLPPREAIYDILRTSLAELMTRGVIHPTTIPSFKQVQLYEVAQSEDPESVAPSRHSVGLRLLSLANECVSVNLSGRSLRRLPVLALAQHIGSSSFAQPGLSGNASEVSTSQGAELEVWLDGLSEVIKSHASEHDKVV